MFPPSVFYPSESTQEGSRFARESKAVRVAHLRYNDIKRKSWWRQILFSLIGRPKRLKNLNLAREKQNFVNYYPLGIQAVKIDSIIGSENRADDFDDAFLPLNDYNAERWVRIAELMLLDVPLPAVDLIKVNGQFYVRDGHHRISVAKYFGQKHIDANVFELVVAPYDLEPQRTKKKEALTLPAYACPTS